MFNINVLGYKYGKEEIEIEGNILENIASEEEAHMYLEQAVKYLKDTKNDVCVNPRGRGYYSYNIRSFDGPTINDMLYNVTLSIEES